MTFYTGEAGCYEVGIGGGAGPKMPNQSRILGQVWVGLGFFGPTFNLKFKGKRRPKKLKEARSKKPEFSRKS